MTPESYPANLKNVNAWPSIQLQFSINFQVVPNDHFSVIRLLDFSQQLIVGNGAVRSPAGRVVHDQNSRLGTIGNLRQFTGRGVILRAVGLVRSEERRVGKECRSR